MSFTRGRIPGIPIQGPPGVKGDKGDTGVPGALRPLGPWAIGTTYALGDSVSFGSFSYASMADANEAHQPDVSPTWWQKLVDLPTLDQIPSATATVDLGGEKISNAANATASGDLVPKGQADATYAAPAISNSFTVPQSLTNQSTVNFTAGGTPKMAIPPTLTSSRTDTYGNLLAGLNHLLPVGNPMTNQAIVPDFAFLQGALRFFTRDITITDIDDPSDLTGRRGGPVGGYPYCGGNGTTVGTGGGPASSLVVANSNAGALVNFLPGQTLWSNTVGLLENAGTPVTITTVTPGSGNVTLGLSASVTLGADTIFSIGSLTGVASGGTLFQVKNIPAVAPFGGDQTTPGALFLLNGAAINWRSVELARDLTGNQDVAQGTLLRFATVKIGRASADNVFDISAAGNVLVGEGTINTGDTGDMIQAQGLVGVNAVHTLTSSATAGQFKLNFWGDPPVGGYATPAPTAFINWNDNAAAIQTALNAIGGFSVTCTGSLPGSVVITYAGSPHNYKRLSISNSTLTGGTISVTNTTTGKPSSGASRFLYFRRREATFTADYFTMQDNTGANALQLTAAGALVLGSSPAPTDNSFTVPTTAWVRTYVAGVGGTSTADSIRVAYTPSVAITDTYDRKLANSNASTTLVSGRLQFVPIWLTAGQALNHITFISGSTAAVTPTAQWFALYSTALAKLQVTQDATNNAWAANTAKTLDLAATYNVPTTGFYLLGCCVVAATPPNLTGIATTAIANTQTPVYSGSSTTGLTNPASAPNPAAGLNPQAGTPYAYVS